LGIRIIENEEKPDERGSSFVFKINGQKQFVKGANWVPFYSFPSAPTRERYREIHTMGAPPIRSLKRFMSDKEISESCGEVWEYHTRNTWNNVM